MKNLKITVRNLRKNPTFGFVTIAGFAFSIAIALLLASYLFNEFSYDKSYQNVDNIYRLCADESVTSFRGDLVAGLKERYPEIENACRYENKRMELNYNNTPYTLENAVLTDNDFFTVFSVNLISGNPQNPMPDDNSVAISSTLAKTIFGNENPVGQKIRFRNIINFRVAAVFDDLPENSSIRAEMIMPWKNAESFQSEWRDGVLYTRVFLLLNKSSRPEMLAQKITEDYSEEHYAEGPFTLLPLSKSYTSSVTNNGMSHTYHANIPSIILFSAVTILILIISILNFVILFTSNHLGRLKEVGIKKANGAGRKAIFIQFISEAVTISVFAFIIGAALVYIFKTPFTTLIEKKFGLSVFLHFPNILIVMTGIVLIGVLAGFYPAFIISKYNPVSIFSQSAQKGSLRIKSGLSVIQYAISIVFIVSLVVIARQYNLLTNKDLGFTKENLVTVNLPFETKAKLPLIKEKLLAGPYVESCAVSMGIPGSIYIWSLWNEAREVYNYQGQLPSFTVDPDFFKVYDVEIIQGRGFEERDRDKSVIINEAAFKLTGWESIEGKVLKGIPTQEQGLPGGDREAANNNTSVVVGVIKDINVQKLDQPVNPTVFECSDDFGISHLSCRVAAGNQAEVISNIENIWKEVFPELAFNYQFYDDWYDTFYTEEQHTAYVVRVFAILSIILTCLGTFGVIHFVTRQRVKEVGIRKVNGAKIYEVVKLLNWEIVKWIVIAFILAVPVSWFFMNRYLREFAFKTNLSWWIFALAGVLALGIALLTVSWQSWRAATRNPVEALRYE